MGVIYIRPYCLFVSNLAVTQTFNPCLRAFTLATWAQVTLCLIASIIVWAFAIKTIKISFTSTVPPTWHLFCQLHSVSISGFLFMLVSHMHKHKKKHALDQQVPCLWMRLLDRKLDNFCTRHPFYKWQWLKGLWTFHSFTFLFHHTRHHWHPSRPLPVSADMSDPSLCSSVQCSLLSALLSFNQTKIHLFICGVQN